MKFKNILLLFALFVNVSFICAQGEPGKPHKGRDFDVEAFKKEKRDFLIKEMSLTEDEAKAFLPLEDEYMDKKFQINRDARRKTRELKQKEAKKDADYKKITEINLGANKKEAELEIEYFKKFGKVLSAEKVEKYRAADLKFKETMLKRHQERKGEGGRPGPRPR